MVQSINLTRSPIEKVSPSLKYYSIFLSTNIPIYMDTNTDHFTPLTLWVKKIWSKVRFAFEPIKLYVTGRIWENNPLHALIQN